MCLNKMCANEKQFGLIKSFHNKLYKYHFSTVAPGLFGTVAYVPIRRGSPSVSKPPATQNKQVCFEVELSPRGRNRAGGALLSSKRTWRVHACFLRHSCALLRTTCDVSCGRPQSDTIRLVSSKLMFWGASRRPGRPF